MTITVDGTTGITFPAGGVLNPSGTTGTGAVVFGTAPSITSPVLTTPNIGTPSAGVLTNATGLPLTTGVTGTLPTANGGTGTASLGAGVSTFLATPSSANLAAAVTDETGSGLLVFATSPVLTTPDIGTPSAGVLTSATGLPLTTGVTGTLPVTNGGTGATTLTSASVLVGAGTSAVTGVAPSTSGNVLTSNGTAWTSAVPASGSPLVFIATTVPSYSATVSFTGLSSTTYIAFMVQFQGMEPGSDGQQLRMRVGSTAGGYWTSGYYSNLLINGTSSNTGSTTSWALTDTNVRSSTNGGCNGIAWISQVGNSSTQPSFFSDTSWWGYAPYTSRAGGPLDTVAAYGLVQQISLFYAAGTIVNGRVTLYGLKAS